jgi:hypothetical protein
MYYIGVNAENSNELTYYCRNCNNVDATVEEEGGCVLNVQMKQTEQKFKHIVNEYTKFDPTLPRIHNVKCPNTECVTNVDDKSKPTEIIYVRYDDSNLKYLYICVDCDTTWKTSDHK